MEQINKNTRNCATCAYWLGRDTPIVLDMSRCSAEWTPDDAEQED